MAQKIEEWAIFPRRIRLFENFYNSHLPKKIEHFILCYGYPPNLQTIIIILRKANEWLSPEITAKIPFKRYK